MEQSAERRASDEAGDPRVYFAAERTLLAWIRTGLALMGFGFVVARFGLFLREVATIRGLSLPSPRGPHFSLWIGTAMVILGVLVNVVSAWQHARFLSDFHRGAAFRPKAPRLGIILAGLLACLGIGVAAYLLHYAL